MFTAKLFRCFSLFLSALVLAVAALAQTPPVRIMPLGDSITGSPGCWRALLWDSLQKSGITNIDFVGTQPPQGCSIPYDGDSEGHGGALATGVADQNQLPVWLAATHPDIVMMHFGTNDVWSGRTTPVILTAFTKLVGQMRASNPSMIILVAQIIPVNPSTCADCAQRTIELNAAIPAWAASLNTAASPIIVVDQWTGFNSATDTSEGVHPNAAGDVKIASKWFPVLSALLQGQTPPPVPNFTLTANPATTSITAGTSGVSTIGIGRTGGFTGSVSLSAAAPAGWSATFSPNPVAANSSVLTVAVPSGVASGVYPVTVSGVAAGLPTGKVTVNVSVSQPLVPLFTLFPSLGNQTINRGSSATNTITINRINGFAGPVTLSASGLPAGVTASFSPNPATALSSVLTLSSSSTATVGTAVVTVSGVGTPGTQSFPINLTVLDPTSTPCGTPTPISLPFARDGVGDFCFVTSGNINFINSWNMQLVEINGVAFTNKWANTGSLPPRIGGNYYIHYVSTVSYGHFEADGSSGTTTPPPPPPPPPPTTTLTVSPTALSFGSAAGSSLVTVNSNVNWTALADQTWISVTPTAGANNGTVTISVTANTAATARTGTVTLAGGGLSRAVGVTQSGVTPPPGTPCSTPTAIALPFKQDGAGDFCWSTSGTIGFINSWNMQLLEINGVAFTNKWASASSLPPRINGAYYIHYVATVPYAHFEASGSP